MNEKYSGAHGWTYYILLLSSSNDQLLAVPAPLIVVVDQKHTRPKPALLLGLPIVLSFKIAVSLKMPRDFFLLSVWIYVLITLLHPRPVYWNLFKFFSSCRYCFMA